MGSAERKERDRQEMREMILAAAKKLFIQKGFEHVTIRRIADAIEYSPATVYLYFTDKVSIFCALQEIGFQELYRRQQVLNAIKNPAEKLRACGKIYIDFAMENQEMYDLMFIMSAPMKKFTDLNEWTMGKQSYDVLRETVQQCIEEGYIKASDPNIGAFSLWALLHGVVSIFIRDRAPMIPKEHQGLIVEQILGFVMEEILAK